MTRGDAKIEGSEGKVAGNPAKPHVYRNASCTSKSLQIMREGALAAPNVCSGPLDLVTWAVGRCRVATSAHQARTVLEALAEAEDFDIAIDVETRGLDLENMAVRTVQLGLLRPPMGEVMGYVLVLEDEDGRRADICHVAQALLPKLAARRRLWSATQFDAYAIAADPLLGVRLPISDAAALHHLVDGFGATIANPLKSAMARELPLLPRSPLKGADTLRLATSDPTFLLYSWLDAVGLRLMLELWREWALMAEGWTPARLDDWLRREQAIDDVARRMERRGVAVDRDRITELRIRYDAELGALMPRIDELAPGLNINSTPQKIAAFEARGVALPEVRRKKTETYTKSTSHKHLVSDDELVVAVQSASVVADRLGRLDEFVRCSRVDGRVHSTFRPLGAVTSRWSSSAPNVQNIPKRGDGVELRSVFVAGAGQVFVQADLSQIEYRMAALLSGDPAMLEVYRAGGDLHVHAAMVLNGVAEPTKAQRDEAKGIGFGKLYGISVRAAAIAAGVTVEEMQKRIDRYDAVFPRLREWCREVYDETGHGLRTRQTPFGRRFKVPSAHMAVNYLCQSSAREVFCDWLLMVAKRYGPHVVLVIHDEIVLEVPEGVAADVAAYCEQAAGELVVGDGSVPIVAGAHVAGREWKGAYE